MDWKTWDIDWNGDEIYDEHWIWKPHPSGGYNAFKLNSREVYNIIEDPNPLYDGDEAYFWGGFYGLDEPANYTLEWDFGDGTDPVQVEYMYGPNNTFMIKPVTHIYEEAGTYYAKLTNNAPYNGFGLDVLEVVVSEGDNEAPSKPNITGPTEGKIGEEYTFKFKSYDSDDDKIIYMVDWGDNTFDFISSSPSGMEVSAKHIWSEKSKYTIMVQAKDPPYYFDNGWATFDVSIPRTKEKFYSLFDMFPILQRILNLLI